MESEALAPDWFEPWITLLVRAVFVAYLGLLYLQVSIAASSLPYVYVQDVKANCGARFLVHYAGANVIACAVIMFLAVGIRLIYTMLRTFIWNNKPPVYGGWISGLRLGATLFLVIGVVLFWLMALAEVTTLMNPPTLPADPSDVSACIALGHPLQGSAR